MNNRIPHYIKPNQNREAPQHIIVVDTETNIEKYGEFSQNQTFRLGFAIYLRWDAEQQEYTETEYPLKSIDDFYQLLDTLALPKRKLVIFSHNSSFDYAILKMDTYFSTRNFEITLRTISQIFLLRAFRKGINGSCSIIYSDTMNYYKMSLEKLGEIFGERKLEKPDFDNVSDEDLMIYCRQDVKVLATVMKKHIRFVKEHDLGNFKLTVASQAFTAFRHRFMHEKILVHNFGEIIELELNSYRGGRCEAFVLGKRENVYKLDVNSMYPFVMKNYEYPIKPLSDEVLKEIPIKDVLSNITDEKKFVLAECDMVLNQPAIAVKKEKLFFPIGKVRQTLTNPEIEYIIDNPDVGKIVNINKCVFYEQATIFNKYVDYFYEFRKGTTNKAYQQMSKLFLNSLYGKFGQKSMSSYEKVEDEIVKKELTELMDDLHTHVVDELIGEITVRYIRLGDDVYLINNSTDILSSESCPIIASTVTSFARMFLFKLMKMAKLKNVFYVDTDSLFVNEIGYEILNSNGLVSNNELGKLKLEEKGTVEIFGAKNYSFNDEIKLKGIKKDARKTGENSYIQSQFLTKNMRYRKGLPDGLIKVQPITKTISSIYDKGVVTGEIVSPHIYNDF
jgi:DNA polymerase elongation subunit (family B)